MKPSRATRKSSTVDLPADLVPIIAMNMANYGPLDGRSVGYMGACRIASMTDNECHVEDGRTNDSRILLIGTIW